MFKMQAQMEVHLSVLTSELPRCLIDVKTCKALESSHGSDNLVQFCDDNCFVRKRCQFENHSSNKPKSKLASHPGCTLVATKKNPRGGQPKYSWLISQPFENATLVLSTVSSAGSPLMVPATFEYTVIDEAMQLQEAESTIVSGLEILSSSFSLGIVSSFRR